MKQSLAVCLLMISGAALADEPKSSEPAAAPASQPAASEPAKTEATPAPSTQKPGETQAAGAHGDDRHSVTYSGVGLSMLSSSFSNVKNAVDLDATMGFRIPTIQWVSAELNLGYSVIPGEVQRASPGSPGSPTGCGVLGLSPCPASPGTTSSQNDFQALSLAAYGVLRSPGRFFGMGKLGYRYLIANLPELQSNRSGIAWGLGAGYRWNESGSYAEFGYTRLSSDLSTYGLTLTYGFGGEHSD